ncbi:MAG TPA: hypothetical protein VHN99_08710 [Deinococcales bacterium]|nr:hypothetical protein [Deinococcales bacterium]
MKAIQWGMGAVLAVALGGCGFSLLPTADLSATSASSDTLSYSVKQDQATGTVTYTLKANQLTFHASAGSLGATIDGYTVRYEDSTGNPIVPGDNVAYGNIGVTVAPGLTCDDPDPSGACDLMTSKNVRYATGPESVAVNLDLLRADIAVASYNEWIANNSTNGWRAIVTFKGKASNGMNFSFDKDFGVAVGSTGASARSLQ